MNCTGRRSRFTIYLSLSLFCLALCSAAEGQTCASDTAADINNGDESLGPSLNAYAIIFRDADPRNPGCNQSAANHLEAKLIDTFGQDHPIDQVSLSNSGSYRHHISAFNPDTGPFQGWLEGGFPTYIFPTALRLYTEGKVNANLEKLLDKVVEFMASNAGQDANGGFVLRSLAPDCNLNKSGDFGNNCMDDYSIAAAGFAWAAAYKTFRQKVNLPDLVGPANGAIAASFSTDSSICVVPDAVIKNRTPQNMPASGRGPCTGTVQDLRATPPAQTLSLNHGHQTPAYGYGLMTSISSAAFGLKLAGASHSFSPDEKTVALALLDEANRLTRLTGQGSPLDYLFANRPTLNDPEACLKVVPVGAATFANATQFQITAPINNPDVTQSGDCADFGYKPRMYALGDFFSDPNVIGASSPGPLPLGFGGSTLFQDPSGFFNIGREVYYGSLGWDARNSLLIPISPLPPLPPNPVYPSDGTLHAPSSFTLRWNDGLDSSRRSLQWPVTYAIYYKAWNYGSPEPASYFFFGSGFQCNPDSSGACTLSVSNVAAGNYRWYVVASMDESISTGVPNSILSTQSTVAFFTIGYQPISTIPAPLPPNPIYPGDGALNVSSSFPVRWNDGLDASRRNPLWPVTYAIYYKYWPFGGFEPANYTLVVAAQPCNSVTFGTCETFVTGEPDGNFRWYVIANMDVSASTGISNSILSTQSSIATFTVGQPPQTGISVVSGTYGGNCGASHGNVTGALGSACNTLGHCDYIVDYTILGDPAPGCAKDYVAEWTCNGQSLVQRATASPEAGFRKTVTLVCP
ncbi:MAG TPA: hypothetical protein VNZ47_12750 [Candidatus Dormibacteraeota bacterium]|nr:hypothetical protein [Candidatus Dormibacteraeota bacterium]